MWQSNTKHGDYLDHQECLRIKLFTPFNPPEINIQPLSPKHHCCTPCSKVCECELCDGKTSPQTPFLFEFDEENPPAKIRDVTKDDEDLVKALLMEYQEKCSPSPSRMLSLIFRKIMLIEKRAFWYFKTKSSFKLSSLISGTFCCSSFSFD